VIRRIFSAILLVWALGFVWFAIALPQPVDGVETDGVIVPTGAGGRIARGLELLEDGQAMRVLVTGVDREVRASEFAAEYDVADERMDCCVTLGFAALDTRGNAREAANWIAENEIESVRLVTSDWHMRRARLDLNRELQGGTDIVEDAVATEPSLRTLFLEYHKLLADWVSGGSL